jgi:hypothetical protein
MADAAWSSRRRSSRPSRSGSPRSTARAIDHCLSARRARPDRASWRHSAFRLISVWDMAVLVVTYGHEERPDGVHARVPLAVPQPNRAGSAIPQAISSPAATSGESRRFRPDRNSGNSGGRLVGSWHEGCAPPLTRAFTSCPPNRNPMRARSPVRSPLRPPTPGGSPTVPADVHLVVPQTRPQVGRDGGRSPRRPPAQLTSATTKTGRGIRRRRRA